MCSRILSQHRRHRNGFQEEKGNGKTKWPSCARAVTKPLLVCRVGSQEAVRGVSGNRIPCWRRQQGRLNRYSFNLELFSLFHFQFYSFIETYYSIWRKRSIRFEACVQVWGSQRKQSEKKKKILCYFDTLPINVTTRIQRNRSDMRESWSIGSMTEHKSAPLPDNEEFKIDFNARDEYRTTSL